MLKQMVSEGFRDEIFRIIKSVTTRWRINLGALMNVARKRIKSLRDCPRLNFLNRVISVINLNTRIYGSNKFDFRLKAIESVYARTNAF